MADDIVFLGQGIEAAITSTNGIDADQEASGYAVENLIDRNQNTLYKPGNTAYTTIKIDMGAPISPTALALINNNAADEFSTYGIRLTTTSNDDWSFSGTVEWHIPPVGSYETPGSADQPIWYETFSAPGSARRYWKLNINGHTADFRFGALLLGIPYYSDLPYNRPRAMRSSYGTKLKESKGGHRNSTLYYEDRKIWTRADFDVLSTSDWEDIFAYLWQASKGGHYPVMFKDVDDAYYWIRVNAGTGNLDYAESLNHFMQASFVFEEEF